jgi:hypothetical protein
MQVAIATVLLAAHLRGCRVIDAPSLIQDRGMELTPSRRPKVGADGRRTAALPTVCPEHGKSDPVEVVSVTRSGDIPAHRRTDRECP